MEARSWKTDESFIDYFNDKLTLAEKVCTDTEKLVDLVIYGIPNTELRNQVRMHCFENMDQLLKAFTKFTLQSGDDRKSGQVERDPKKSATTTSCSNQEQRAAQRETRRCEARCFNCNAVSHTQKDCQSQKRECDICFKCGSPSHKVATCMQRASQSESTVTTTARTAAKLTTKTATAATGTVGLVQSTSLDSSFVVSFKFSLLYGGITNEYSVSATVDSGSRVSLLSPALYRPYSVRLFH